MKILRPLLELSSKEVTFYSVYHKLDSVFIPSLCTKVRSLFKTQNVNFLNFFHELNHFYLQTASDSSIHNLSKQFVMDLMENFPSTVSTVFRTGEKLGSTVSSSNCEEEDNFCILCLVKCCLY